jgi:hypothetical protein
MVDLLVDRVGRGAGGVVLFGLTTGLALAVPSLSVFAACALAFWIAIAIAIRPHYIHAFREALEKKVIEPEALGNQTLDGAISRALLQALSSADDRQVLYALDLLATGPPARWRQYLPTLIEHRSSGRAKPDDRDTHRVEVFSPRYVEKLLLDEDLEGSGRSDPPPV